MKGFDINSIDPLLAGALVVLAFQILQAKRYDYAKRIDLIIVTFVETLGFALMLLGEYAFNIHNLIYLGAIITGFGLLLNARIMRGKPADDLPIPTFITKIDLYSSAIIGAIGIIFGIFALIFFR